jgi:uncharacterized membrane protein YoaK (UPF0700 family)
MTTIGAAAPRQPLPALLMVLTAVTGLVDATSILGMDRVFTANMTGNVVFLGLAIGGAPGMQILPYAAALAAFVVGAWIGGHIGKRYEKPQRSWLLQVAAIETALFWAAAVAAVDYVPSTLAPAWRLYALIILTSVAMGLRNATVRQFRVPDMTTTVLTLTLTGLAADSHFAGGSNTNWRRRFGGVLAVFTGAAIGALLVAQVGLVVPLVVTGCIVMDATIGYTLHPATKPELSGR